MGTSSCAVVLPPTSGYDGAFGAVHIWNGWNISNFGSTRKPEFGTLSESRRLANRFGRPPGIDFVVVHCGTDRRPMAVIENDQPTGTDKLAKEV